MLRASRLFSLPSKLPRPPGEITIVASRVSTTSTAVFPTLQSVTTTQSSRNRGDWGFKRPLPRHTTASTSTPLVRVKHVDSIEAVTDFASAADHTLSLQKWHEMNLPVVSQSFTERNNNILGKSVFEDSVDFTAFDPSQRDQVQDRRWKFDGPWLPGINEAAFRRYMATHVRPKRAEFRQFLRQQLVRDLNSEAAEKAFDGGKTAVVLGEDDITDEQLDEYMRALRNGPSRATLYGLISKFLDLAPVQPPSDHFAQLGSLAPPVAGRATSPYAKSGPLVTHPSSGMSYLRTNAFIYNHPVYGPQKSHAPVEARVVMPKNVVSAGPARIGVGGFVTDSPEYEEFGSRRGRVPPKYHWFDPAVVGGSKVMVTVSSARVNAKGRINLYARSVDAEAALVQGELEGREAVFGHWAPPQEEKRLDSTDSVRRRMRLSSTRASKDVTGSAQSYGLDYRLSGR